MNVNESPCGGFFEELSTVIQVGNAMDRNSDESPYGQELIVDVHNVSYLFTRFRITDFCIRLCEIIEMERGDLFFWDYKGDKEEYNNAPAHLKGISAVQFIKTSNITIHSLDELKRLYLNIFSCKPFETSVVRGLVERRIGGDIVNFQEITRV